MSEELHDYREEIAALLAGLVNHVSMSTPEAQDPDQLQARRAELARQAETLKGT